MPETIEKNCYFCEFWCSVSTFITSGCDNPKCKYYKQKMPDGKLPNGGKEASKCKLFVLKDTMSQVFARDGIKLK
jgi:hypothetical protein